MLACGDGAAGTPDGPGPLDASVDSPETDAADGSAAHDAGAEPDASSDAGDAGGLGPDCELALSADFAARDELPQSPVPEAEWYVASLQGTWGPAAAPYPPVEAPAGCAEVAWKRQRVMAVAEKYVGLPYQHHHIPAWDPASAWPSAEGPGLDCSNFSAWAYDYALGIAFTSNVEAQADGAEAPGRRLAPDEAWEPADLLYISSEDLSHVAHVVLLVDAEHIIDSTGPGVQIRSFTGWYQDRYSHARRVIE
jgi:cell wall-associated NlpC family hydrolase